MESDVRARIGPASEQRASALTSLSRSLSRAATGSPDANRDGDPEKTRQDLEKLGDKLDEMTDAQRRDLARQLAEMQATARSADGAAAVHSARPPRASRRVTRLAPVRRSIGWARR